MATRLFVSYRASDGKATAAALARDLGRHYGADNVFLDKDDLPGGGRWREDVQRQFGPGSALLLVLTPDTLGARHADGRRRIDDPDDPVRRELALALDHGLPVLPLLTDGVTVPDAADLPEPFARLNEFTMRPLRAYDWPQDLQRLVADLRTLGLSPAPARRLLVLGGVALLVAGTGAAAWWWQRPPAHPLQGRWRLEGAGQPVATLHFEAGRGDGLTLHSDAIDIRQAPGWQDYRAFWQERFGQALDAVAWRGEGRLVAEGEQRLLDMALQVRPAGAPQAEAIATGNLSARLAAGRRGPLQATLWWNAEQKDVAVSLRPLD